MPEARMPLWRLRLILAVLFVSIMSLEVTVVTSQDNLVLIPGDVNLVAIFRTNEVQAGQCGEYSVDSLQELMAVTWFLDSVNAMNYVNNVTIGLEAVRTCKMPEKANQAIIELMNKYEVGMPGSDNTTLLFGFIGPDRTSEATAVSKLIGALPANQRVLQISGSATGRQLSDRTLHPNFFRVIPSDALQIQVILDVLLQLDWNYIAIIYSDGDYGRGGAFELRRLAEQNQICVPVFESLPEDVASTAFFDQLGNIATQVTSIETGSLRGMVVIAGESITRELASRLQQTAKYVQLVLSEAVGLQTATLLTANSQLVLKGALLTAPPDLYLPEFTPFWNELWTNRSQFELYAARNVWLRNYFTQITGCELNEVCWDQKTSVRNGQTALEGERNQRELSLYIGYHVKATAAMVSLLKKLHTIKCGSTYSGVCPQLRQSIVDRLEVQDLLQRAAFGLDDFAPISMILANFSAIRFDTSGDITGLNVDDEYNVYNLRNSGGDDFSFEKVGSFSSGQLSLNKSDTEFYSETGSPLKWAELPTAQCAVNHDCLQCEHDNSGDVVFIEGDFYILCIVPVHDKYANDLLRCGKVKGLVGADLLQAVIYAINSVNEKRGRFRDVLPNRRVGLVGLSSCGSKLLVKQRLMDFFSGRMKLPNGNSSSMLFNSLIGMVGGFFSSESIAASEVLTALEKPFVQVSPASTSTDLKNRVEHPLFMRLVPPDDKQAQVMLDIVERLGADYIQVIYDSSTAYATGLYNKLQEEIGSGKYKVCIAQSIPITPRNEVSQYKYIADVLRDESAAKIVIVVLHATQVDKVMTAILPLLTSEDNFLFLASESWGRRQSLIEGRTSLEGSLILSQEIAVDKIFERYFREVDPIASANPWLKYFWENRLNCYLDKSFQRKDKVGRCPDDFANDYVQDSRVPFHIQAAYALVQGFDAALKEHCGPAASSTCSSLTSSELVSAMHKVELDLYATGQYSPVFDNNGDGLVGFKVLKVSRDLATSETAVVYKDVGQWTTEGLDLDLEEMKKVSSVCPNELKCGMCFSDNSQAGGSKADCGDDSGIPVSAIAGLAVASCLFIAILIIVVIKQARRIHSMAESAKSNRLRYGHNVMPRYLNKQYVEEDEYVNPQDIVVTAQRQEAEDPPPAPCGVHKPGYITAVAEPPAEAP